MLYDKLCREDVLRRAYADVRLNRGAPGVDDVTFDHIENEVGTDVFLAGIRSQLIAKRYKPRAVRRVYIPKSDGKQRPLGIPVIADRVVQAAAKIVLEPLFEGDFADFSYGWPATIILTGRRQLSWPVEDLGPEGPGAGLRATDREVEGPPNARQKDQ